VIPPEWFDDNSKHGTNMSKEYQVGSFSLIIDESLTDTGDKPGKGIIKTKGGGATLWR